MSYDYEVIVVGGGHAGVEAAAAAARLGAKTVLVTHRRDTIGEMSCNPAIGGLGKGHLVREIDALDGLMGRVADQSGIQFRLLNRSKGPAVRGPRAQIDRALYRQAMQSMLEGYSNLDIVEAAVEDLAVSDERCVGVILCDGRIIRGGRTVLTTGTFLRGVIHRGEARIEAGRVGDAPANALGRRLESLGLPMGRLKTGTPARLDGRTIDWSALPKQPADSEPVPFSFTTSAIDIPQIECGITYTNDRTHDVISSNLSRSAVYGGAIAGRGPRYCPSIEDKVVRFADRAAHQVFLEPEGLSSDLVYPNGVSTSLPEEIQDRFLRTIDGLSNVEVRTYGYAIEYDYVDPRAIRRTFELRALPGLFLAGQINGTTGYEEAGAQGLLAGLNAALDVKGRAPFVVERHHGYMGVLTDDLITRGVTEPYRMFTSRAEYRLSLRADNADERLTPLGIELGCVSDRREQLFHVKRDRVNRAKVWANKTTLTPNEARAHGIKVNSDGRRRSVLDLLALPDVDFDVIATVWPEGRTLERDLRERLEADALYAGYLDRQAQEIEDTKRHESLSIPSDLDFATLPGLSREVVERLERARPETLAQAGRLEGMTPSALAVLLVAIRRRQSVELGAA